MSGTFSSFGFSVSLNDVTWQYSKNPPIFHEFSWTVYPGQIVTLTGKNMIGKTTLLRLLAGELIPERGSVQRSSTVEYLPQNFDETLFPWKSAEWNVALPLLASGSVAKPMDALSGLATKLPLWEAILPILTHPLGKLSGGLRHLVSIARALTSSRSLILMDEPFTGLDVQNLKLACASIKQFAEMNPAASIVITTHIDVDLESPTIHYLFPEKRPIDKLIQRKGS